ncbi:PH domain-containing protein [Deinococcus phoenicis]|uniref:PH domain-containing protein n=1 Tax=Deinococcus phoenicis TaxID=1476583 RepID=UPI0009DD0DF5|nr:PH domain-containing protein [Deinococcus phoenicis]
MAEPPPRVIPTVTVPPPRWWPWVRWLLVAVLLGLLALPLLPGVLRRPVYEVRGGEIVARSVASSRVIPAGTGVDWVEVRRLRKTVGSDAPGYVVGRFEVARFGEADLYTDGSSPALVFLTRPRVTVLTPADPHALLRVWEAGETGTFYPARPPSALFAVLMALVLLGPLVLLLRPARIRYTLLPGELVTRSILHTQRFPLDRTSAEVTREGLGVRLFGTAVPGYLTGTYALKAGRGGRVQAVATTARPDAAVLLTLDGTTYYLTPADPREVLALFAPLSSPPSPLPPAPR